jgi:hypothetical protein
MGSYVCLDLGNIPLISRQNCAILRAFGGEKEKPHTHEAKQPGGTGILFLASCKQILAETERGFP